MTEKEAYNQMYYQTVIFDLDGTLLDTLGDLAAAGNAACRAMGWPGHSEEGFRGMVGHGIANLVTAMAPPDVSPQARTEAIARFNAHYAAHCMERTRPCPGVPELLDRLQAAGIVMGVCSNKDDAFCAALMDHYYPGMFARVQGRVDGIPVKPDPAGVLRLLDALGADPSRTLYAGDSATDVRTGHNAGLAVCAVTWGFRSRRSLETAGPEYLARTAPELERIVRSGEGGFVSGL